MTYDTNSRPHTRVENLKIIGLADPALLEGPSTSDPGPLHTSDATRVDQALSSVLEHRNDPYVQAKGTLSALRKEVDSLRYRASDEVRFQIRKNPWHAVGIAVFAGFLFGITR